MSWTNLSSGRSRDAGGSTAAPLNRRASPTRQALACSGRRGGVSATPLVVAPISRAIASTLMRPCIGEQCVASARDELRSRSTGCNLGCKLSATERNSEQLRSLGSAEEHWIRLDRSGWGPGGRRFKSCLPDSNFLQSSLNCLEVYRAGCVAGCEIGERCESGRSRGGAVSANLRPPGHLHPVDQLHPAGGHVTGYAFASRVIAITSGSVGRMIVRRPWRASSRARRR